MIRSEFTVVGGSYAGLSAALQLARARREVTVIDAGQRRNRWVDEAGGTSHGFLSRDGVPPGELASIARDQLLRYPNVRWLSGMADDARPCDDGRFSLRVGTSTVLSDRVVIATGVRDELPAVAGLAERWGRSVFHCPYCHGHEMEAGQIGIIASSEMARHHAIMLSDWGTPTLFLNGAFHPSEDDLANFARRGTRVETTRIVRIDGVADIILEDGRRMSMRGLFTQPRTHMASPIAAQLGCVLAEGPTGAFIQVDSMQQTSVPNVFACGDAARAAGNVALAVADGAMAGVSAHRSTMI
ncbi:NAD(P)/FAD-dependent oxidoreductase [Roseateles amylovorans]|uniref:NAD(P)/FAD-dependent oxidoreductase n=1 Tax=Roseateles amylovorans TaxID=2978473 RepID=A0ABY6AYA3_9BURK|nr:NAD(P)/FAD-dependent oxidoreductase [Roseateles amylovorans]UXH77565.1 NAD(P)/FAD-dependent oxidoreductase [Roseateles amylovorans]